MSFYIIIKIEFFFICNTYLFGLYTKRTTTTRLDMAEKEGHRWPTLYGPELREDAHNTWLKRHDPDLAYPIYSQEWCIKHIEFARTDLRNFYDHANALEMDQLIVKNAKEALQNINQYEYIEYGLIPVIHELFSEFRCPTHGHLIPIDGRFILIKNHRQLMDIATIMQQYGLTSVDPDKENCNLCASFDRYLLRRSLYSHIIWANNLLETFGKCCYNFSPSIEKRAGCFCYDSISEFELDRPLYSRSTMYEVVYLRK